MTAPLSFKDAAFKILRQAGQPLSAKAITAEALKANLIATDGQTPEATMAAQLYVDLKRNPKTPFEKVGRGLFGLRSKAEVEASPQALIDQHNATVRKALMERLRSMDAYLFEALVGDLLQNLGYENVEVTKRSGDGGIDLNAHLAFEGITSVRTVVQVKRNKAGNNVNNTVIAQLRGSAEVDQRGLVVTTSDFTPSAIRESRAPSKMPVALVNGARLVDLLIKNGIGVKSQPVTLHAIDDDFFDNPEEPTVPVAGSGRAMAIWPLPGGADAYVDTLLRLLRAIDSGTKAKSKLTAWFQDNFESVESERTATGYLNVPRTLGLITITASTAALTTCGKDLLASGSRDLIYKQLSTQVCGIEEMMEFLEAADDPQDSQAILDFLKENLGIEWKTFAQLNYRLYWLRALGKVDKIDGGWVGKASTGEN